MKKIFDEIGFLPSISIGLAIIITLYRIGDGPILYVALILLLISFVLFAVIIGSREMIIEEIKESREKLDHIEGMIHNIEYFTENTLDQVSPKE